MSVKQLLENAYNRALAETSGLMRRSDVFCMAPWIQLHAQTNGKVSPCCMSSVYSSNEIGDLRQNPRLEDAWNSSNMKQLRLNMLKGEKSTLCGHCYKYEALGRYSERKQYNRDYKRYYDRVRATNTDGSLDIKEVPIIDIRFSNKCNYKCRICNSEFSSLWYEEERQLGKGRPAEDQPKEMRAAEEEAAFWESYKSLLPYVRRLHFAGGEPLFMDEHYETLDHLIEIGNTEVTLSYNTNFSTLRYKKYDVLDMWSRFKNVDIWASLDGMGAKGDYQRKGQKWEKIEENLRELQKKCPHAALGVNVTVSMLNVLDVPEFIRYMIDQQLVKPERLNLYLLFYPEHFSVVNLSPELKQKAVAQFEALERDYISKLEAPDNIRNHIKTVVTYMMGEEGERQEIFRNTIREVDAIRGEDFLALYPEFAHMMNSDGV